MIHACAEEGRLTNCIFSCKINVLSWTLAIRTNNELWMNRISGLTGYLFFFPIRRLVEYKIQNPAKRISGLPARYLVSGLVFFRYPVWLLQKYQLLDLISNLISRCRTSGRPDIQIQNPAKRISGLPTRYLVSGLILSRYPVWFL